MTTQGPRQEAERILELAREPFAAFQVVERQMNVLVLRTQVLLSLCGIVITVTGFSGRAVAETGPLAKVMIAAGIFIVLTAAAVAIGGVLRLRWLTQELGADAIATLERAIAVRDAKARFLGAALVLFVVGFTCYCVAIAQLLISS